MHPGRRDVTYEPISLGNTCEAKLQIARKMNDLMRSPMSDMALRLYLAPPHRGAKIFGWGAFDYQVTPFYAAREFIRRDFVGVYEREDLEPGAAGSVLHKKFPGVNYIHDYDELCPDQNMTHAIIDQGHAEAKARFEARAEAFLRHIEAPGAFLYVAHCEDFPGAGSMVDAIELMTARNRNHRVHFLLYGLKEEDSDLSGLEAEGLVTKIYRVAESGKPAGREFEGNDAAWDVGFDRFQLALPV